MTKAIALVLFWLASPAITAGLFFETKVEEKVRKFIVIPEQEESGAYGVHCPALPGCSSQGNDRDEALSMIVDAIQGVLEVIEERGERESHLEFVLEETPALFAEEVSQILEFCAEYGLPLIR